MRTVKTIAYFLSAALLAGCERDAAEEVRPVAGERPLLFTARIAGGDADGVSVGTRDGDINKPLDGADSARNALLKKTFTIGKTASECDAIRICNVGSSTEQPTFGLSNPHCFQYICSKHNTTYVDDGTQPENPFPDTGSTEEDNYVNGHNQTWSEYLFMPDSTDGTKRGFYISNLISDGNNYFRFYALWCRGQEEESLPKIRTDQHKEEDFLNSDAMLAGMQHNINNFDKPIRLIFSHIHAMLDVRIALPTYDAGYKRGEWDETEERLPSGYRPADVRLCMTNVKTDYQIDAATMTDAGTLVAVKPPEDAAAVDTIGMHRYYLEDEAKENEAEEGTKVDLGHLEDDDTDGTSKSLYRIYGFCGILPPQTWNDGTPMLRLYVNDPITGKEKTYVYIPDATNGLKIEGGRISVLKLKLSRTADDMLVVMGNVEDWDPATGDVYVTEDQD